MKFYSTWYSTYRIYAVTGNLPYCNRKYRYGTVCNSTVRVCTGEVECFEENDLHMPEPLCGEWVGEAEDHRVKKGLFCLYCLNKPTKRVLS